jgi:hypothetical protein
VTEPQTLQALLDAAMAQRGATSGRRLAELAQEQGYAVTHTTVNAIRAGAYRSRPSDETLRAIAWLAGRPEQVAFAAAGLPAPGRPFAEELPPGVDALSPRARRAAVEMLRVLVEAERLADPAGASDGTDETDAHVPVTARSLAADPAPALRRDQVALAARGGEPAHGADTTTGEGSQAPADEWEPA